MQLGWYYQNDCKKVKNTVKIPQTTPGFLLKSCGAPCEILEMTEGCSGSFVRQLSLLPYGWLLRGLCEAELVPLGGTCYFQAYDLMLSSCSVCGWSLIIITEKTPYAGTHTFTCAHHRLCIVFPSCVFGHLGNTFPHGLWLILFFCYLWAMFTLHYAEKPLKSSHVPSHVHTDSLALSNSMVRMFTFLLISDVQCKRLASSFLKTAVMKLWRNSQGTGAN